MAWVFVAVLCALIVLLVALYRRALADTQHMFSLMILILLDDNVRVARKTDLINFVRSSKAQHATQLSLEVFRALRVLANGLARTSVFGAHAQLWHLRNL
jgi:hypothetical protein